MDLILRDILKRSDLWESYKRKHNIVENYSLRQFMEPHLEAAEKLLFQEIETTDELQRFAVEYNVQFGTGSPDEEIEPGDESGFQLWLKEAIETRVFYALGNLTSATMEGGEIIVYRQITAPENWIQSGGLTARPLGEYWAWEEDAAEAHWGSFGSGHINYLIVGSVSPQEVDWPRTLMLNASVSYEDERELTIVDHGTVKLHGVYVYGAGGKREFPIGKMAGQQFPVM